MKIRLSENHPPIRNFAAGAGHMVKIYCRAKECDKTPLGNVDNEKPHFSS